MDNNDTIRFSSKKMNKPVEKINHSKNSETVNSCEYNLTKKEAVNKTVNKAFNANETLKTYHEITDEAFETYTETFEEKVSPQTLNDICRFNPLFYLYEYCHTSMYCFWDADVDGVRVIHLASLVEGISVDWNGKDFIVNQEICRSVLNEVAGNLLSPVFSQKKYKHEIACFSFDEISELAVFLNTCLDLTEDEAKSGLILPLSKSSYVEIPDCNNITDCIVYTIGDEKELSKDEALLLQKTILEVREFLDECSKQ